MTKDELKQYLIDEAEYASEQVEAMDNHKLFDAWLKWNGICGFTDDIIDAYKAAFENKYLTFDNLIFNFISSIHRIKYGYLKFSNGYGVSVIGLQFYSIDDMLYEVACIKNGNVSYPKNTSFENDVVGYVTKEEVTKLMKEIQDLPKCTD